MPLLPPFNAIVRAFSPTGWLRIRRQGNRVPRLPWAGIALRLWRLSRQSQSLLDGEGGEFADQADGFDADTYYLADQADDVFGIVFPVGIVDDAAAVVCGDLMLSMTHSRALRLPSLYS
jgi:hypothetical protein